MKPPRPALLVLGLIVSLVAALAADPPEIPVPPIKTALEGETNVISLPAAVRASLTGDDWAALLDFADRHLLGKPSTRRFDRFPNNADLDALRAPISAQR